MKKGKEALNLSVNAELKRLMKIQCATDGEDVSEVTERLYRAFLEKQGLRIKESRPIYRTKRK